MYIIYSDKRARLIVKNVSNLLTINMIGLPLELWDATSAAKAWLRKNHSADDSKVKSKKAKDYDHHGQQQAGGVHHNHTTRLR